MSVTKRLSFRLAAPIVVLTVSVLVILYFLVVDTMGGFANDRAEEDLKSISREVLNICNLAFNELAQSGGLNKPTVVRVQKALILGELEELLREFKLDAVIWKVEGARRSMLIATPGSEAIHWDAIGKIRPHRLIGIHGGAMSFYAYGVNFQPWGWRIVLLRHTAAYQRWTGKIRRLYVTIGALLLVMAFGLITLQGKLLRRPIDSIVQDLRRGETPTYEGIEELEFLSHSIAGMMQTLADREARLQESEIKYRTIFETTGTAIIIAEEDTTISLVNNQFIEYSGYSKEELEGKKSWTAIVVQDDLDRVKRIHELRRTNPDEAPRQYEFTMEDRRGDHKHILLTADIIPGTTQTIASLMDITDHRRKELELRLEQQAQAAEALRKTNIELAREIETRKSIEYSLRVSEERFRAIFETAEDCIFIKNTELEYTHVNPAYMRLLDRPVDEIIGSNDQALSVDPDYAAHAKNLESRVLRGESFETEHTLTWKGWPVALNVIRFPLRDSLGATFGICGIARDVSDRKARQDGVAIETPHAYSSAAIQETIKQVTLAAESDSTVLFFGESGSGKDYWARFLHDQSHRSGGSYLAINCAALSPGLVESELFGHEAGAFTGARGRKRGMLELAEGGTLLLNEIGEMPLAMQAKLLTFLDTQTITRVGGERSLSVDTRIMAATNRDLPREIDRGRFRQDLYYRLAVFTITTPPLRDRIEDLPILVQELIFSIGQKMGLTQLPAMDPSALDALMKYHWPGNVRELSNVLERALILGNGERIVVQDLGLTDSIPMRECSLSGTELETLLVHGGGFQEALDETKRFLITNALRQSDGSIKDAAVLLGMTRNSITYQMRSLGLRK
jgi:PAS domain S-box-containing protein